MSYPVVDALGTTTTTLDSTGAVAGRNDYDSFGKPASPRAGTEPYGWTGLVNDSTGLVHARSRNYDPATGSFLSEDPVANTTLYRYGANNPLTYTDPTGRQDAIEEGTQDAAAAESGADQAGNAVCKTIAFVDAFQTAIDFRGVASEIYWGFSGPANARNFRIFTRDANGNMLRQARFDVNPADTGHIKKYGAHLNLEETIGGKLEAAPGNHTPIDKSTVRSTDYC